MADKLETTEGDLSAAEVTEAKKAGIAENVKDSTRMRLAADTGTQGDLDETVERDKKRVPADLNTTPLEQFLALGVDAFEDRVTEKPKDQPVIPEDQVKGLLALERAGQNRTPYVKALMKRLGVKSPYEVTNAGPGWTNDVSTVTAL